MNCDEYFRLLHNLSGKVVEESCAQSNMQKQAKSLAFVSELDAWHLVLSSRHEAIVLRMAATEYQYAMFLLSAGVYRYAFGGLRAALELTLTAVDHSANLIRHLEWMAGKKDITWASLIATDTTSVLSKSFCGVFFPELVDEVPRVNELARLTYRDCSEHVHGNPANAVQIPREFAYSDDAFIAWHRTAESVQSVIRFALVIRYLRELKRPDLEVVERHLAESMFHLKPVRSHFLMETA